MMKHLGLILLLSLGVGHPVILADTLRVSAAASLSDVLKAIMANYEKETGSKPELNIGASNVLMRQIEEGAPVDVFISADEAKMDALQSKGLIDPATREDQLANTLVIVVPQDSTLKITGAGSLMEDIVNKIATGDPKAVPAGIYAKQWLEKIGVWEKMKSKMVATESVRAALAAVESGNVDAGIVYKTDAGISLKVKVVCEVTGADAPRIVYPMAVLKASRQPAEARKFLDYLDAPASKSLFEKFGFVVLPDHP